MPWLRVHRRPRIAILATGDEKALEHDAGNPSFAVRHLRRDFVADIDLAMVILAAVGVTDIDDEIRSQPARDHPRGSRLHGRSVVVRFPTAAAQDHMAVGVAGSGDHRDGAGLSHGRCAAVIGMFQVIGG